MMNRLRQLRGLLARESDFRLIGDLSATECESLARSRSLLLDVRMRSAAASMSPLRGAACTLVIFDRVSEHAVDAFRVEAVDYLLKPFDDRFAKAIARPERCSSTRNSAGAEEAQR